MSEQTVQTLRITKGQKSRLRNIARDYGFTIGRGLDPDMGSINQLAVAIADGDLIVIQASTRPTRRDALKTE